MSSHVRWTVDSPSGAPPSQKSQSQSGRKGKEIKIKPLTDSCIHLQKPVTPSVLGSILTKRCRGLLLKSTVRSTWFFPAVSSPAVISLPSIVRCSRCSSLKLEGTEMNPTALLTAKTAECRTEVSSGQKPHRMLQHPALFFPFLMWIPVNCNSRRMLWEDRGSGNLRVEPISSLGEEPVSKIVCCWY